MGKMKKWIAGVLACAMTLGMGTAALAVEDQPSVTLNKQYNLTGADGVSPAETFGFLTVEKYSVSDSSITDKDTMPDISITGGFVYAKGDAGKAGNLEKKIAFNLPELSGNNSFPGIGIYTYKITENPGNTAGVTYQEAPVFLVVTVVQDGENLKRVYTVHAAEEDGTNGFIPGEKLDFNQEGVYAFRNTYSAGKLEVTKEVTGNMGDRNKEFDVTVTFTAPANKSVGAPIKYVDGTEEKSIAADWENGTAKAVITLKHNDTVTFTNIPAGVEYKVEESDYTADEKGKYDAAKYLTNTGDASIIIPSGTIGTDTTTVKITNNKGIDVDTGVILDSLPYIIIFAVVIAAAVVALISRKRRFQDDYSGAF